MASCEPRRLDGSLYRVPARRAVSSSPAARQTEFNQNTTPGSLFGRETLRYTRASRAGAKELCFGRAQQTYVNPAIHGSRPVPMTPDCRSQPAIHPTPASQPLEPAMAVDTVTSDLGGPAAGPERLGVVALYFDMIRRPSAALARIAERPKKRWIVPLVTLAVLTTAFALIYAPKAMEASRADTEALMASQFEDMDPEQLEAMQSGQQVGNVIGIVFSGIGGAVGTVIAALLGAAVLHFLATVMGGQQAFLEVFSTTVWAKVALIVGVAIKIPWVLAGGFDPNPAGLAGLVSSGGLSEGRSYFEPLLSQLEIWNVSVPVAPRACRHGVGQTHAGPGARCCWVLPRGEDRLWIDRDRDRQRVYRALPIGAGS